MKKINTSKGSIALSSLMQLFFYKQILLILPFAIFIVTSLSAQTAASSNKEATYLQTITQRSNKIVSTLGIQDSAKFYRVQSILVKQYSSLNTLHEGFTSKVKTIKKDSSVEKSIKTEKITAIETERSTNLLALHKTYLADLAKELTEEQIVRVKDGMTYNKVAVTYNAYIAMIPSLTEEQKSKINTYLIEVREYAMDAESSEKKTEWFGKYKGKINNYLSAQGYDVKKEGQEWEKRIKEKKENNNSK